MPKQLLARRLSELKISPEELSTICRVDPRTVEAWIADGPDAEGAILLRFLSDDADALRRVDQLRRTFARNLRSEDWQSAPVDVPYGTADTEKMTGGVPS